MPNPSTIKVYSAAMLLKCPTCGKICKGGKGFFTHQREHARDDNHAKWYVPGESLDAFLVRKEDIELAAKETHILEAHALDELIEEDPLVCCPNCGYNLQLLKQAMKTIKAMEGLQLDTTQSTQ